MHGIILEGLSVLHGLSNQQDLSNFLRELRPTTKSLWQAYRSNIVKISYRKPTMQAAYMLRYFPYHAEVTRIALCDGHCRETMAVYSWPVKPLGAFMLLSSIGRVNGNVFVLSGQGMRKGQDTLARLCPITQHSRALQ